MKAKGILILIVVLVFSMLTGCAEKPKPSGSGGESSETVVDLDGYEFTILSPFVEGIILDERSPEIVKIYDRRIKEIEEKYNCKISGIAANPGMAYMMPKILAGEKVADVIDMVAEHWIPASQAGYLTPWTEVPNVDLTDPRWTNMGTSMGNLDGVQWGINWIRPTELRACMFFNKTLLSQKNQPDLYELVENKEWTFEKFRTIAKAVTAGSSDIKGLGYHFPFRMIDYFVAANNVIIVKKNEDNKYVTNFASNDYRDALDFLYNLTQVDKLVDIYPGDKEETVHQAAGDSLSYALQNFKNGKTAFLLIDSWFAAQHQDMKDDYGLVPIPMGPAASDYISLANDGRVFVTTSTNQDLDKTGIIFSALADLGEGYRGDEWWLDDMRVTNYRDDESVQNYNILLKNSIVDPGLAVPEFYFNYTHNLLYQTVLWGKTTTGAGIDAIKDKFQEQIDAVFTPANPFE